VGQQLDTDDELRLQLIARLQAHGEKKGQHIRRISKQLEYIMQQLSLTVE